MAQVGNELIHEDDWNEGDGTILRQILGIPMGDPLSPGMCILTCGWMEGEWLAPIPPSERELFRAARYMDDIIMFISSKLNKLFHSSVKNECYWPPLKLEEGSGDTFLETFFRKLPGGAITFRLKM